MTASCSESAAAAPSASSVTSGSSSDSLVCTTFVRGWVPPDPLGTHPRTKVVQTRLSELLPEVTDEALGAAAADSEQLAVMRRRGYRRTRTAPRSEERR